MNSEPPAVSIIPSSILLEPGDTVTIWAFASDNAAIETFSLQIDGVPVTVLVHRELELVVV